MGGDDAPTLAEVVVNGVLYGVYEFARRLFFSVVDIINVFVRMACDFSDRAPPDEGDLEQALIFLGSLGCAALFFFLLDNYPAYLQHPIHALTAEGRERIRARVREEEELQRLDAQAQLREHIERERRDDAEMDAAVEEMREKIEAKDGDFRPLRKYDKTTRLAFLESEVARLKETVEHVGPKSARKRG